MRDDLRRSCAALLTGVLLAACTEGSPPPEDDPGGTSQEQPGDPGPDRDDDASPARTALPPGQAGDQLAWVLARLHDGEVGAADLEERFTSSYRRRVEVDQLRSGFQELTPSAPWQVRTVSAAGKRAHAYVVDPDEMAALVISLVVDEEGRMDELVLAPGPTPVAIDSLAEGVRQLADLAPQTSVLVGDLDEGCAPLAGHEPERPRAIASSAKPYVIDAVAQAVMDGTLTWDEELEITDVDRSAPWGPAVDQPTGATFPVRELSRASMAHSDNTATDLLLTRIGRDRVEATVAATGHATPALLRPFLRTREVLRLGWGDGDRAAWAAAWEDGDEQARRDVLQRLGDGVGDLQTDDLQDPAHADGVDWWASAADLCRLWHRLLERDDPQLREILAVEPGAATLLAVDAEGPVWEHVGFKNGHLPGVVSVVWSLERHDGRRFVVAVALNSDETIDQLVVSGLVAALIEQLTTA